MDAPLQQNLVERGNDFEAVLHFWFPESGLVNGSQFRWWFGGSADAAVIARFASLLERARRGKLHHWAATARSRLALIIVLDQFSRTVYRAQALAFAQDPLALSQQISLSTTVLSRSGKKQSSPGSPFPAPGISGSGSRRFVIEF